MEAREAHFEEVERGAESLQGDRLGLDDLNAVPVRIDALLGAVPMTVRDILDLKEGSVVPLQKTAGEMTDIHVNGLPLAKGEVVVIGDNLHVRIAEITGYQSDSDLV